MTHFTQDEIIMIGDYLITKFGTYYQTFWNCQHFARLLVLLLTGKRLPWVTSTDFVAGCLFRVPFTGSILGALTKGLTLEAENKILQELDPEYGEIVKYALELRKAQKQQNVNNTGWCQIV
jgi:hypothetical protein